MVTRPGRLYPLNSPRIATDVIKRIAVQLRLPDTASRADTYPMLEGKIEELGHDSRNVQVRITVGEDSSQSIELVDADGAFLQVDVPAEDGSHSETDVRDGRWDRGRCGPADLARGDSCSERGSRERGE